MQPATAHPSAQSRRALTLLLVCGVVVGVSLALRFLPYAGWDLSGQSIDGRPIMATPDAYRWLAGTNGFGAADGHPMALMIEKVSHVTGWTVDKAAFLLPPLVSTIMGVSVALWAWSLGFGSLSIIAGVLAIATPNYFFRTHFGYYDTDFVTLTVPTILAYAIAQAMGPWTLPLPWSPGRAKRLALFWRTEDATRERLQSRPIYRDWLWLLFAGVIMQAGGIWHPRIETFSWLFSLFALCIGLVMARPGARSRVCWNFLMLTLVGQYGSAGLLAGGLFTAFAAARKRWFAPLSLRGWAGAAALAVSVFLFQTPESIVKVLQPYIQKYVPIEVATTTPLPEPAEEGTDELAALYEKTMQGTESQTTVPATKQDADAPELAPNEQEPAAQNAFDPTQYAGHDAKVGSETYPAPGISIHEAQKVSLRGYLKLVHLWEWPALLSLAGFAGLLFTRSRILFILPMAALGVGGVEAGMRLAMFLAPTAALGLGGCFMGVRWLLRRYRPVPPAVASAVAFGLFLVLLVAPVRSYTAIPPPPACIGKRHAEALLKLGEVAPAHAMVWTWWDYGYPVNYFAGLRSFATGGERQHGSYIMSVGRVLSSDSPLEAHQLMAYTASTYYEPWQEWKSMERGQLDLFLRSFRDQKTLAATRPQYLVVAWEFLHVYYWVGYYGSWQFSSKTATPGNVVVLKEPFSFNNERGVMTLADGRSMPVRSIDVLSRNGVNGFQYKSNAGPRLLVNMETELSVLIDDAGYDSNLTRLLLRSPQSFEDDPYFKLVVDDFPYIRIFQLRE